MLDMNSTRVVCKD